jgi:hypothetical protein
MKQLISIVLLLLGSFNGISTRHSSEVLMPHEQLHSDLSKRSNQLYDLLVLDSLGLSWDAWDFALKGQAHLIEAGLVQNPDIITIIDYSLPSTEKRLFVIDLESGDLLFHTLVSHGRNSGKVKPTQFSNKPESFQTSLGFYVTQQTYQGKHGYSLRLLGTEKGINDKALDRGIVMHAADYVNASLAQKQGYIGRSLGCPAIPPVLHQDLIKTIKDGSCLFMFSPDKQYLKKSKWLQPLV